MIDRDAPRPTTAARTGAVRIALVAGAALVLLTAAAAYAGWREWRASIEARLWVDHTYQVIDDIRRLFDDVQDAETGARGYLLTGDATYLAPFDTGIAHRGDDRDRLWDAVRDNPDQLRRFVRLDALLDKKFNVLSEVVEHRRSNQAVSPPMPIGRGRVQMEEIRTVVDEMIDNEHSLLTIRDAARDRSARANLRTVVAAFVLAVLAIAVALALGIAYVHRRRLAEEAAAAQAALLAATLESMGQGIGVHDAGLRLLLWNRRYQELSGVEDSLFVPGVSLLTLLRRAAETGDLGDDAESWIAERMRILTARVPYETERARPDGSVLLMRGTFTEDGLGVTTFSDITALKRTQRDLTASLSRLNAIFANTLDGIVTVSESGTIESFNPAAERIFGFTAHDLIGRNIKLLMPEPFRGHHDGYLRQYQNTGEKKIIGMRRELEGVRSDGSVFPIELAINEFWSDGRRLFVGMLRDISERRQVERIKSEFISTVSHELRTPLTSISGSLGLLVGAAAGELPDRAKRLIEIANKNSERLVRLVNDILDLDKISRAG